MSCPPRPFGKEATVSSGFRTTNRNFTGRERDDETGFLYYGARYYDPEIGRFIWLDSVVPGSGALPQGFNRHAYAFNNPIRYVDPDGHRPWAFDAALGLAWDYLKGSVKKEAQKGSERFVEVAAVMGAAAISPPDVDRYAT